MTRNTLLDKGIKFVEEAEFRIDELISSRFNSIEKFLYNWCFGNDMSYTEGYSISDLKYYVRGGENKRIAVLVWLEK